MILASSHWDPITHTCVQGSLHTPTCTLGPQPHDIRICTLDPHDTPIVHDDLVILATTSTLGPNYSYMHAGTPLLLPVLWDPMTHLPAHWDPVIILPAHWDPYLLPEHWDPITPTCTLGPNYSYLHIGNPHTSTGGICLGGGGGGAPRPATGRGEGSTGWIFTPTGVSTGWISTPNGVSNFYKNDPKRVAR